MNRSLLFFFNSILLGIGLAMDAFSVSLANGLQEPMMKKKKVCGIAAVFACFQGGMPVIGWFCVHSLLRFFYAIRWSIHWIAFILLLGIGGKMLAQGITHNDIDSDTHTVGVIAVMIQGVATSIDALSVGFAIAEYNLFMAVVCALIIAVVTFFICLGGVLSRKRFGTKLADQATILGGLILIGIGLEIFFSARV